MPLFENRRHAGQKLAEVLTDYSARAEVLVLALPRGGVPVGYEVARALHVPLDVWLVRKLGVPGQEELAMGAISLAGIEFFNSDIIDELRITPEQIKTVKEKEQQELARRNLLYRQNRPMPDLKNKTIILVDDGIATGASIHVAIQALKTLKPAYIVVATPVGAVDTLQRLANEVDEIVCLYTPEPFYSVGQGYQDFTQTTDKEVSELLRIQQPTVTQ